MGRHADPDPRHFWGSLGTAVLRAGLALGLVVGLFAALSTIGGGVPEDGPVMLGEPPRTETPLPVADQPSLRAPDPPAQDRHLPVGDDPEEDGPDEDPAEAVLAAAPPPEETRVQALDGVGDLSQLALLVAALQQHGYQMVATNPARTDYEVTTVLYTEGQEAAARALQARDPRIKERRLSPGLSEEADLHVVLGADWQ